MTRRRSQMVCLGLTAVLATALTGCGADEESASSQPEFAGICVDKTTGIRLDDSVCGSADVPEAAPFIALPAVPTPAYTSPTDLATGASPSSGPTSAAPPTPAGCVPVTATSTGGTATATLGGSAPPTTPSGQNPSSTSSVFEGPCPPGHALNGSSPAPSTTTVHRSSTPAWFFIPWGSTAPQVGGAAHSGSYRPPSGAAYSRGGMISSGGTVGTSTVKGGTISRGGFGKSGAKAGG